MNFAKSFFSILAIAMMIFVAPAANANCLLFLSRSFGAGVGSTASVAVGLFEMSDRDLKVRVHEGAAIALDRLVDKGADLTKLEKILSENWLMGVKAGESGLADRQLTEDKIRAVISDQSLHVLAKFTFEFFSVLERVLFSKPELARELREIVLGNLRRRIYLEQVEQASAQDDVQSMKRVGLYFEPTSTGAVFEPFDHPTMGRSVKAPIGRVWSKVLPGQYKNMGKILNGIVTNSDAVKACEEIGGRLPSREEYEELRTSFELTEITMTAQGGTDLRRVFQDMKHRYYWSSSVGPKRSGHAYLFNSQYGNVGVDFRYMNYAVRCVAQ